MPEVQDSAAGPDDSLQSLLAEELSLVAELTVAEGVAIFTGPPSATCACSLEERRRPDQAARNPLDRRYAYREGECPLRGRGVLRPLVQHPSSWQPEPPVVCVASRDAGGFLCIQCAIPDFPHQPPHRRGLAVRAMTYALLQAALLARPAPPPGSLLRQGERARALLRAMMQMQRAELERLALEVHDGIAQTLVAASQLLQALPRDVAHPEWKAELVEKAGSLVLQASQDVRGLITSLQAAPPSLPAADLVSTLRRELYGIAAETGWAIDFYATDVLLPSPVAAGLYRIAHEAITNARRHSRTLRLRVALEGEGDRVRLQVQDWGVGFDVAAQQMAPGGFGLRAMQKRAELLGGATAVRSSPGSGTLVDVSIPLEAGPS